MDRFIRRENVKHYRELLKKVKDEAERQKIRSSPRSSRSRKMLATKSKMNTNKEWSRQEQDT
jgi:hypothetical protein